eukprot:TRINITY_DN10274_c0_g1_i3.p1 TRINITY_DN10274_c0_g1~~TRINITY_DN10274_c0_g1_i3.p1  ORF type:complete len:430 (+),score=72.38 TRINITY_DN10274_c0_g1_i3:1010-2299(+)
MRGGVASCTVGEPTNNKSGCILSGTWFPEHIRNATAARSNYDREIDMLETNQWLDDQSALVQLSCLVWSTNSQTQAHVTHSVELFNTGYVRPKETKVTVSPFPVNIPTRPSLALLMSLYFFCEELQDLICHGGKAYFVTSGWLNLFDLMSVVALLLVFVFDYYYYSVLPDPNPDNNYNKDFHTDVFSTMADVQAAWQLLVGLSVFALILKGLKFTNNVPVMSSIGNTFSRTILEVGLFMLVMGALLFGFAVLFHMVFAVAPGDSFTGLGVSLFSLFRGLLGDLNVDDMMSSQPIFGPMFYVIYVTVVLFVGFTILIAIISDSYESVKGEAPIEGLFANMMEASNKSGDDDCEVQPAGELEARLDRIEQSMSTIMALLQHKTNLDPAKAPADASLLQVSNPLAEAEIAPKLDPAPGNNEESFEDTTVLHV